MRLLTVLALTTAAAAAHAQSVHFPLVPQRVAFRLQHTGYAPMSTVQGVTVLRCQKDYDAWWSANNGRPGLKNAVAPYRVDFEKEQLVAIVLPAYFGFDALPTVTCVEAVGPRVWRIDVSPARGSVSRGVSQTVPYVAVRTPIGPDCLDIVLHDPDGRPTHTIHTRPFCPWHR